MKTKKILWLENEISVQKRFIKALESEGHEVNIVDSVSQAENFLRKESEDYDLFILDIMIPLLNEQERENYPAEKTEGGTTVGLAFYRRNKSILEKKLIPVLVCTLRMEKEIKESFIKEGLPAENFHRKLNLQVTTSNFVKVIQETFK